MATRMRFSLGHVVSTQGASATLNPVGILALVRRHASGDWGDLDKFDQELNERAITGGDRIFSCYQVPCRDEESGEMTTEKFYVITEWDRSVTTILLASEY